MKIKRGGGGVDADGKAYTLPETECEVPDDYFQKLVSEFAKIPRQQYLVVPKWIHDLLKKES